MRYTVLEFDLLKRWLGGERGSISEMRLPISEEAQIALHQGRLYPIFLARFLSFSKALSTPGAFIPTSFAG
jgi:hypothetical protein